MIHAQPAAKSLGAVFGPTRLEEAACESNWVKRRRDTTGPELISSIIRSLGSGDVKTIADLHRCFNAHHGAEVDYKAFYRRLTSDGFAVCLSGLFEDAMTYLSADVIAPLREGPFEQFEDILVHDGTSFAVHDDLKDLYPGRFNKRSPAAVELHITMSLFTDNMVSVTLAPDVDSERKFMPDPADIRHKLLLMDRGYDGRQDLQKIDDSGGSFVVRIRSTHKPRVINAYFEGRPHRRHARRMEGQRLDVALKRAPKDSIVDLDVCWEERGDLVNFARLVCIWNPTAKHWVRLLTNLNREAFSADDILTTYRLRWQIELLNKELKSYSNLRRFTARNAATMEGLIWASLCATLLKRFIGQVAQLCGPPGALISTHRVATCGEYVLRLLCPKLMKRPALLLAALREVLAFLCRNAKRTSPRRDNLFGRLKLGLTGVNGA